MFFVLGVALAILQDSPDVRIPPDKSLAPEAYIALGMPAADREWSEKDYATAAAVLNKIAETDPAQLPRRGSRQSAGTWSRICSDENFNLSRNTMLPMGVRLPFAANIVQTANEIFLIYIKASGSGPFFDSELIDLSDFGLRSLIVLFDLAIEARKSIPADGPAKETYDRGFETMRKGLATSVHGALRTLRERDAYRMSELLRSVASLKDVLPTLAAYLPSLTQKELPVLLKAMIAEEQHAGMKQALEDLLKALPEPPPMDRTPPPNASPTNGT